MRLHECWRCKVGGVKECQREELGILIETGIRVLPHYFIVPVVQAIYIPTFAPFFFVLDYILFSRSQWVTHFCFEGRRFQDAACEDDLLPKSHPRKARVLGMPAARDNTASQTDETKTFTKFCPISVINRNENCESPTCEVEGKNNNK